jgi:hypothetical protein
MNPAFPRCCPRPAPKTLRDGRGRAQVAQGCPGQSQGLRLSACSQAPALFLNGTATRGPAFNSATKEPSAGCRHSSSLSK